MSGMISPIAGIDRVQAVAPMSAAEFGLKGMDDVSGKGSDGGFSATLKGMLKEVDSLQKASGQSLQDFSEGKVDNVHDVMAAMSRADLSFRMMLEVRNKLVDAYQNVIRTQV